MSPFLFLISYLLVTSVASIRTDFYLWHDFSVKKQLTGSSPLRGRRSALDCSAVYEEEDEEEQEEEEEEQEERRMRRRGHVALHEN